MTRRPISRPDREYVVACLFEWLRISYENGQEPLASPSTLYAGLTHSALFARLCDGQDPLPSPPPRAYAYPWYGLIEQGWATGCTAHEAELNGATVLVLNQAAWEIVEREEDGWIVTHERTPGVRWRVTRDPGARHAVIGWRVDRLTPTETP